MSWVLVAVVLLVLVALIFGWRWPLCICRFRGGTGRLWIDPSCRGCLSLWVIPEDKTVAAFTPATSDTWYSVDGFVIAGQVYKIDGSTCVYMRCDDQGNWSQETCVNLLALVWGSRGPRPVPAGTFANEPLAGAPALPVQ